VGVWYFVLCVSVCVCVWYFVLCVCLFLCMWCGVCGWLCVCVFLYVSKKHKAKFPEV